ncbi:MAG: aminotransferase class V-fold PLP-dependent enzyme [Acidisphaera sp.]|nr:aminotransferase class V-fold PLP-dependent enzyme [Acidisphaera sp.]
MTLAPLFDRAAFHLPPDIAHVCAGGETPFLRRHEAALRQYALDKSAGPDGRAAMQAQVDAARHRAARSWNADPDALGFVGSVAEGVSLVAESLDWRPGDTVCVDPAEYPSVVGPFALQRRPPVALRFTEGSDPGRFARAVDARTRVIAASCVSYLTGERLDLATLRAAADAMGALLVVDFTQAAGYLPIEAGIADFAFSSCYKWLLGTTGVALAYWNRARQPGWAPTTGGWHSIALPDRPDWTAALGLRAGGVRFTRGNPPHAALYVLAGALEFLSGFEAPAITAHVQRLTTGLMDRLGAAGIACTTPRDPARHGASVCIDTPHAQALAEELVRRGVYVWNGHGRLRFSFHGYNGEDDVDRIVAALGPLWRG